ncbi:hypothetical protein D3C78_871960 [compost metagenome]
MDGDVVLLLVAAGMHPQPHVVARVGAQHRRERVARQGVGHVDVRRESGDPAGRAARLTDLAGRQVERRDGAVGAALQGEGEVAGQAVGLHARLAVRAEAVGVEHPQAQRLVAVVDHEDPRVLDRDRIRARPARAAGHLATGQFHHRLQQATGIAPCRRVDSVAEGLGSRRVARGVRHPVGAGADVHAGLVGMLEVAVLEEELAEAVVLAVAVEVAGGDHRLPGGRSAVGAGVQRRAGFGVEPAGAGRLGQHGGVETDLLVGGWAEVVVGEDVAQATVDIPAVDHRVGEPALHGGPCAQPVAAVELAKVRVRLLLRAFRRHVTVLAAVELADGVDTLDHGHRREHAVLVVPAVGRTIGGGQVPLGQVDVLADHVGRGAHLVVIQLVERRDQVGVVVHGAVEGVHPHHQRFRRLLLVDHRHGVLPQGEDARLREVVADLVEHRVELDVGGLVDPRLVGGEGRGALERQLVAAEELAETGRCGQALAAVIHARLEERRTAHRQGAVGAEGLRFHFTIR